MKILPLVFFSSQVNSEIKHMSVEKRSNKNIQKYFIDAAEIDGYYVDQNRGREKLKALLSFCQN